MAYIGFKEDFTNNYDKNSMVKIEESNALFYKVKSTRNDKEYVAKIYKPKKLMEDLLLSLKEMISYFVVGNKNPYTVKIYEIYGWTNDDNEMVLVLVFDYCDQGSLMNYIDKKLNLPEESIVEITKELVNGFDNLIQENGIHHRDIKPDCIYFKDNKVIIGDFDVCNLSMKAENFKVENFIFI